MNRKKLVDVIEQVLTPVDDALDAELRKHLELTICDEVSQLFKTARHFVDVDYNQKQLSSLSAHSTKRLLTSKLAYETVKPVLDDCIDRSLVPDNDDA